MIHERKELYVRRCFDLARLGKTRTKTNPLVGSVIVRDDRIIGEGYHQFFGGPHAEVNAVLDTGNQDLSNSNIYVSLEPCVHHGKTPPCTDLLISKQLKACTVSLRDVNPIVRGKGLDKLRKMGIEVEENVLPKMGQHILRAFLIQQRLSRPYITLKWAQSDDGYMGYLGSQTKISNALSDRLVHKWRSEHDAILVGTNTIITDNPSLTNRLYTGKSPIRVCIDRKGRIPADAAIFRPPIPTLCFTNLPHAEGKNITNIKLKINELSFVLEVLLQRNIGTVFIEGGKKLLESCLSQGLWDECLIITSGNALGQGVEAPKLDQLPVEQLTLTGDRIQRYVRTSS